MDNKKWYKKIATIFWWILTALPIIVALIYFIGYHFAFNSGITTASELTQYHNSLNEFIPALETQLEQFMTISITPLTNMFSNLFTILNVEYPEFLGALFGYMLSIQMYHLLFDCLVFFIHLIHSYTDCERWNR